MSWQVQEAKQRFSEVLRAVQWHGPQTITRHGTEIAVVIDIDEYRRLTAGRRAVTEVLIGPPYLEAGASSVLDEIVAERARDLPRDIDLGIG